MMSSDTRSDIKNFNVLWTNEHEAEAINNLKGHNSKRRWYYNNRTTYNLVNLAAVTKGARKNRLQNNGNKA